MASPHSRRSSVHSSANNSPFVPSPRWLSDSPGRPPSVRNGTPHTAYVDRPGAPNAPTPQPDPRHALRSPVPPPPANLHQGQTAAFNVDPGIPFLATAGPTDDGQSSPSRSVRADEDWPSPRERKFGGGIVSGLKRAVGSLRQSRGSRASRRTGDDESYVYTLPPQFRDSGYGNSTPHLVPPQGQPPLPPPAASGYVPQQAPPPLPNGALLPTYAAPAQPQPLPPQSQAPPQPQAPLQPHSQTPTRASHSPVIPPTQNPPLQLASPPSTLASPISADPDYGSDYAQMDPPTPPPSDTPLTTYLSRAQRLIAHIAALPWVAPERVTADYYPERAKRSDEPKHAPQIRWAAQDYARPSFRTGPLGLLRADGESEAGTWDEWEEEYEKGYEGRASRPPTVIAPLITPRRGGDIDLGEEFEEARNTPMAPTPAPLTPYHGGGGGASLYGGYTPHTVASRMATPSLYSRPMTPTTAAATPAGTAPPLPQDPPAAFSTPAPRIQTLAAQHANLSRPPSTTASVYQPPPDDEFDEAGHTPAPATPHYGGGGGGASLYGGYTPHSTAAPSLYGHPTAPAAAGATPSGGVPPLPQDPRAAFSTSAPRVQTLAAQHANASRPPSMTASVYQQPLMGHPNAPGSAGDTHPPHTPTRSRASSRASSSMYAYTLPPGGAGSQASSRSHRSTTSARLSVPARAAGPGAGAGTGAPVRVRGASVSSSAYGGERAGSGWDSGYAESFREGGAVAGGRAGSGYGRYVPPLPPPLPLVGVQMGAGGSVRSGRSGSGREWGA